MIERNSYIENLSSIKQNKKSRLNSKCWQCKICEGYYMYPRSHFQKFHKDQLGDYKTYFFNADQFNQNKTQLDCKIEAFETEYLRNPRVSGMDNQVNTNGNRDIQSHKNRLRETIQFATKNNDPSDVEILEGVNHLCDDFLTDQLNKKFKAGTVKNKLISFQHYLNFLSFKIKRNESTLKSNDLSLATESVKNTIKSLKSRIKMNDSQVAIERSKFFWNQSHEKSWIEDPKTIEAERYLNHPEEVGDNKTKFVKARNHLLLKLSKMNGKRNLEIATMKIDDAIEPNCVSCINDEGKLEYVIYNNEVKTKKSGGISKITLDEKLMNQTLSFIQIIRPKFTTDASQRNIFITTTGTKFSACSMSKLFKTLEPYYTGVGKTTNQNFRFAFGSLANEFGSSKDRRIMCDQQDHSESTMAKFYEQNPQTSIKAVNKHKQFMKDASEKEMRKNEAEKTESASNIKKKMGNIKEKL